MADRKHLERKCFNITFYENDMNDMFEILSKILQRLTFETWCDISYSYTLNIQARFLTVYFIIDYRYNDNVDKDIQHIYDVINEELSIK